VDVTTRANDSRPGSAAAVRPPSRAPTRAGRPRLRAVPTRPARAASRAPRTCRAVRRGRVRSALPQHPRSSLMPLPLPGITRTGQTRQSRA
jgi:hypothetical protein